MKKKATITVETERLLVITRADSVINQWCHGCQAEVTMLALEEAAALAALSHRTIFQLAEIGRVHLVETNEGQALFCVRSLSEETSAHSACLLIEGKE